jgi:hypothetical protein
MMNIVLGECKVRISAVLAQNERTNGAQTSFAQKQSNCILNEHEKIACKGHKLPYRDVRLFRMMSVRTILQTRKEYHRYHCMTDRRVGPHRIKDLLQ